MNRFPHAVAICLLLASCATSEEAKSREVIEPTPDVPAEPVVATPTPTPASPPDAGAAVATALTPAIASVQMAQDCPKKTVKKEKAKRPMPGAPSRSRIRPDGNGNFNQPCTQSSIQISVSGVATPGSTMAIKGMRLLTPDGKQVATVQARMPTLWKESGYVNWDGVLTSDAEHKASYHISVPDWAALEKTMGKSTYNMMFVLDVDVEIGGTVTTVRSPSFERTQPMMIRT